MHLNEILTELNANSIPDQNKKMLAKVDGTVRIKGNVKLTDVKFFSNHSKLVYSDGESLIASLAHGKQLKSKYL